MWPKNNNKQNNENDLQNLHGLIFNKRFSSTTTPEDQIPENYSVILAPISPNSPNRKKIRREDVLSKQDLIDLAWSQLSDHRYEEGINNLIHLFQLHKNNIQNGKLKRIADIYLNFHTNPPENYYPTLKALQDIVKQFIEYGNADFDQPHIIDVYNQYNARLLKCELDFAMEQEDYLQATEIFLSLARHPKANIFSPKTYIAYYLKLFPKMLAQEHEESLRQLQWVASLYQEKIDAHSEPYSSEIFHYNQFILQNQDNELEQGIDELFICIDFACQQIENETGKTVQEAAKRLHHYLGLIAKKATTPEIEERLFELNLILNETFLKIYPEDRTTNDWQYIPHEDYTPDDWECFYNITIKEINKNPSLAIAKIEKLVICLSVDTVTEPGTTALRLINLNHKLFKLYLEDTSDINKTTKINKIIIHTELLFNHINKIANCHHLIKDNLTAAKDTFTIAYKSLSQKEGSVASSTPTASMGSTNKMISYSAF